MLFYTYTIEVDGKNKGTLPYFASRPECEDTGDFLFVEMRAGTHTINILDQDQNVIYEYIIKATGSKMEASEDSKGEGNFYVVLSWEECNILQYVR